MSNADETYLTPQKLVARWADSVTVQTLANWRAKGVGPAYIKIGTRVAYPISAVVDYETKNRRAV